MVKIHHPSELILQSNANPEAPGVSVTNCAETELRTGQSQRQRLNSGVRETLDQGRAVVEVLGRVDARYSLDT